MSFVPSDQNNLCLDCFIQGSCDRKTDKKKHCKQWFPKQDAFECGWKEGKLVLAPHLTNYLNKITDKGEGLFPVYSVFESGIVGMVLYTKNKQLPKVFFNFCPYCGGKLYRDTDFQGYKDSPEVV